jgi:CHASE2 domain-containing sensor protein
MPKKTPRLSRLSTRERALFGLLIGIVVAAVFASVRNSGPVERFEWRLVDARTQEYMGSRPPDPRIVMAVIDDQDIERLKQGWSHNWPWPLSVNALAFKWMAAAKVKAVAVDVLHFDQGIGPKEHGTAELEREGIELAQAFDEVGEVTLAVELAEVPRDEEVQGVRLPALTRHIGRLIPVRGTPKFERPYISLPAYQLLQGAKRIGFVNQDTDDDGVIRRASPLAAWRGKALDSLALATAVGAADGNVALSTTEIRERIVLRELPRPARWTCASPRQ